MKIIDTANLHLFIDLENSRRRFGMLGTLRDRYDPTYNYAECMVLETIGLECLNLVFFLKKIK